MHEFRIRLFGGLEVYSGDTLLPSFSTERSKSLFAFLVLNRDRCFHRDVLCGHFWGEFPDAEARKALRTALWRVRSVIEPGAQRGRFIRVDGDRVGFVARERAWIDAAEFEECLRGLTGAGGVDLGEATAQSMVRAASLYRGDLLEGNYEEWCLFARERLRLGYLAALERLVGYHRGLGQWLDAIIWGRGCWGGTRCGSTSIGPSWAAISPWAIDPRRSGNHRASGKLERSGGSGARRHLF